MTLSQLLDRFRPGTRIYLPGATGEIAVLNQALGADPGRMAGVNVVSCPLPGMNTFDFAALHPDARMTTFLFLPATRDSLAVGKVDILPLSYFGAAHYLRDHADLDIAVVHVAPPSAGEGRMASAGIAADFTRVAWDAARTRIAFVNPAMPAMPRGPRIDLAQADLVIEEESPLCTLPPGKSDPVGEAIARQVARFVEDGSALQIGIGAAPSALWRALGDRKNLRLRSGLASEDLLHLDDKGALAADGHVAGIAGGSIEFYRQLAGRDLIRLADTFETHDWRQIGREDCFIAANSAVQADLFGQVNLEWQGGKPVSGVGGAPDFAAAALASPGGRSITMLPATARKGTISRIVARLDAPSVSLPRYLADVVVTEHGTAELRSKSLDQRAEALIAIAEPAFRPALAAEWRALRPSISA